MNDNAKAWIAALRSGKYKQGTGALCDDGRFCCLGVACDLAVKAGVDLSIGKRGSNTTFDEKFGMLPRKVQCWLGLASDNGSMIGDTLVSMNDIGSTFSEIADLIESEPAGLFAK